MNPHARAVLLKAAEYPAPHEPPGGQYPYALITGRTIYQFHTRTKTARPPELQAAAPEVWVEMSGADAERHGIAEGDLVEVASPRGDVRGKVRITGIRDGVLFVPFHYGYWDVAGTDHDRAANEVTVTDWDPCSKQPILKTAAATVPGEGGDMKLGLAIHELHRSENSLAADLRHLHRVAAGVSLDWELLAQGAQAAEDAELVAPTRRCHPQTLRQLRWANAMLKILSPQFLAS